ncbi:alpha/beta fold hydrolase [Pseudonocardia sp. CA-107938]|uniref:alpha/beta fold hydrolase n=1 Tax=Pseudonocardia sp. CA-107938 TaxID=3240021 RepID=UPI003D914EB7
MIALVHGVPETTAIWDRVVAMLDAPVVRLSPPGFGAPVPDGWGASVEEYRSWLVAELEALGESVDLVGHDFGAAHVVNVAMTRPDLLRTWAADVVGWFDPGYVWHPLAQVWQTPGDGEASVDSLTSLDVPGRIELLASFGIPRPVAEVLAPGCDAALGRCVLGLYRSAAQPALERLGAGLERAAARPGLAILPTEDGGVGDMAMRRRSAARAGAEVAVLEGVDHWWPLTAPEQTAARLRAFWAHAHRGVPAHTS